VYNVSPTFIPEIQKCLKDKDYFKEDSSKINKIKPLYDDLQKVDKDCVVVNFECCGGCDDKRFLSRNISFID